MFQPLVRFMIAERELLSSSWNSILLQRSVFKVYSLKNYRMKSSRVLYTQDLQVMYMHKKNSQLPGKGVGHSTKETTVYMCGSN